MKPRGIEEGAWEIVESFPEFGTHLILSYKDYYFVTNEGFFIPHNYNETNQGLCDFRYASIRKGYRIQNIKKVENGLFQFEYWQQGKRSDFRWDEYPTGFAHPNGRRMFFDIREHEFDYLKSELKKHELIFELVISYPPNRWNYPKVYLFFSISTLKPLFAIYKNETGELTEHKRGKSDLLALNDFEFEEYSLRKRKLSYLSECELSMIGKGISMRSEVKLAEKFLRADTLLHELVGQTLDEYSILGLPKGVFGSMDIMDQLAYTLESEKSRVQL